MPNSEFMELPVLQGSKTLKARIPIPPTLTQLDHGDAVPEGYGVFRVLTEADGDKRFAWNPMSIVEINEAKDFYIAAVAEGFVPYVVGTGGNASSEVMRTFDPFAGEVIFVQEKLAVGG